MKKTWHDEAWEKYLYWQGQDKRTIRKINELLKDIERNGYKGKGKPEPLKGDLAGWWSVQIDEKNRLVFKIEERDGEKTLVILQCGTHYGDK